MGGGGVGGVGGGWGGGGGGRWGCWEGGFLPYPVCLFFFFNLHIANFPFFVMYSPIYGF